MANPRDLAGNTEEEERLSYYGLKPSQNLTKNGEPPRSSWEGRRRSNLVISI